MATISSLTHLLAFLLGLALASLSTETSGHLRNLLGSRKTLLSPDSKDILRSRILSAKTASATPPDSHTGGDVILPRYFLAKSLSPAYHQISGRSSICTNNMAAQGSRLLRLHPAGKVIHTPLYIRDQRLQSQRTAIHLSRK